MLNLTCSDCSGYSDLIKAHIARELPQITNISDATLVDVLTEVLYSTKNLRFGAIPPPEYQVKVREVVRHYTQSGNRIPVLVPWGSIKANFSSALDMAELTAIQTLVNLNNTVKKWYEPGLEIVIRIEDTSGFKLFSMENNYQLIVANSQVYSRNLVNLINLMSDGEITPLLESDMAQAELFNQSERINTDKIYAYLRATRDKIDLDSKEYFELKKLGWKGAISHEQREHYLSQYRKLYHDYDENRLLKRLAMYFGGSLTRHQLNMTGKQDSWDNLFIQLSFVPPIKGLPEGYNHNYIYYRTVPMNQSRTHLPPWRAKGYLRIEGRTVTTKLSTFNDLEQDLYPGYISLHNGSKTVNVNTDYYLV